MAGSTHGRGDLIAGINVTPFVDIALVLLVIFVVTAKIIVSPAVAIDLPHAGETEDVQVILSVLVPAQGAVLVNGQAAADEDRFHRAVAQVRSEHPEVRAVIHAEASAQHSKVLQALDRLRRAGIHKVAFAAEPLQGGPL